MDVCTAHSSSDATDLMLGREANPIITIHGDKKAGEATVVQSHKWPILRLEDIVVDFPVQPYNGPNSQGWMAMIQGQHHEHKRAR
jgi:hypothetical protein